MSLYKKILTVLLVTIVASVAASAQTHYDGRFWVGAKGGVTLSRTFFNPSVPQSMLLGTEFGVRFKYAEEKHFGILAELNFRQSGWKESFKDAPQFSFSHTLNYIQLPVLTHIYFGSEKARFYFNAGPSISLMLSDKVSSNFDYTNISNISGFPTHNRNYNQYKLDKTNKLDYGISAGLGAEVNISRLHSVDLEARFYYGLGNAFPSGRTHLFNSTNGMSIEITAGYWFRIK